MSGITRRTALAAAAGSLALPGLARAQAAQQLAIATGTTGGVYYPLGGALANYLSRGIPGMSATVEVTGGSVANMQLLGASRVGIAITQVDAAVDAVARPRPLPRPCRAGARHRGALHQPHAGGDGGLHRHPLHAGPEGQAHLHRRAGLGDRGDGLPPDRGCRPRPREGFPRARAPVPGREHQRDQGRQARRLFLRLRRADQRRHRPRRDAGRADRADRPRPVHPAHRREIRPGLFPRGHPGRTPIRARPRRTSRCRSATSWRCARTCPPRW